MDSDNNGLPRSYRIKPPVLPRTILKILHTYQKIDPKYVMVISEWVVDLVRAKVYPGNPGSGHYQLHKQGLIME